VSNDSWQTVGQDEAVIREFIRHQEREDERLEQMKMLFKAAV
jgi:hypothetical protein